MVYCNLAVLLAERRIRISKVSTDTGISRTTLTALCQNAGKGVQIDTINTLCMYLDINVGELFSFFPFNIKVSDCDYYQSDGTADLVFSYESKNYTGELHCMVELSLNAFQLPDTGCSASICVREYDADVSKDIRENNYLRDAFQSMPHPVIDAIKTDIADAVIKAVTNESNIEVDGEVYGSPEAMDAWEFDVTLPPEWKKT